MKSPQKNIWLMYDEKGHHWNEYHPRFTEEDVKYIEKQTHLHGVKYTLAESNLSIRQAMIFGFKLAKDNSAGLAPTYSPDSGRYGYVSKTDWIEAEKALKREVEKVSNNLFLSTELKEKVQYNFSVLDKVSKQSKQSSHFNQDLETILIAAENFLYGVALTLGLSKIEELRKLV